MGMEAIKWLGWLGWQVKQPGDYWRAAVIGTPLLGLFILANILRGLPGATACETVP